MQGRCQVLEPLISLMFLSFTGANAAARRQLSPGGRQFLPVACETAALALHRRTHTQRDGGKPGPE
jgi:hypothetical protein